MKPCTRCGGCCRTFPCSVGATFLGDHRPCKALEMQGKQYACGMVLHASRYIDLGGNTGWKDELLREVFGDLLGIGWGCCRDPETDLIVCRMRAALTKLKMKGTRAEPTKG